MFIFLSFESFLLHIRSDRNAMRRCCYCCSWCTFRSISAYCLNCYCAVCCGYCCRRFRCYFISFRPIRLAVCPLCNPFLPCFLFVIICSSHPFECAHTLFFLPIFQALSYSQPNAFYAQRLLQTQ